MSIRVVVAGGGTGGHLFPGIAVVEEMRRQGLEPEVTFVGTRRGIEARVLPKLGEEVRFIEVHPLKGRGPLELLRNLGRLPSSGAEAVGLLRELRPDLVLGVGGYAAGPVLAAALAMRIPTALMEQNAVPGLTNRVLVRHVGRAYASFDGTFGSSAAPHVVVSGNPVRRALVDMAHARDLDPEARRSTQGRILVLGGSLGARALNQGVPALIGAALGRDQAGATAAPRVVHQVGRGDANMVKRAYQRSGIDAEVFSFIEDISEHYKASELVIARAGASTVAELCALGCASILVPFPQAADDHQSKNALALAQAGAAVHLAEDQLGGGAAEQLLRALWQDRKRRQAMSVAARRFGRPDAAATIVDDLSAWLGWGDDPDARRDVGHDSTKTHSSGASSSDAVPRMRSAPGLRGAENSVFGRRRPYIPPSEGTVRRRAQRLSDEPAVPFMMND